MPSSQLKFTATSRLWQHLDGELDARHCINEKSGARSAASPASSGLCSQTNSYAAQMKGSDVLIILLCYYFIAMNLTVERCYCHRTMEECKAQGYWLADMTVDFCAVNNPREEDVTRYVYADGMVEFGYHGLARSGLLSLGL